MRTKFPKRDTIVATWPLVFQRTHDWGLRRRCLVSDQVYRYNEQYVMLPARSRPFGPYSSLAEVLEQYELAVIDYSVTEISSPELSSKELARMLSSDWQLKVGFKLKINGEYHQLTPAKLFGRCRDQSEPKVEKPKFPKRAKFDFTLFEQLLAQFRRPPEVFLPFDEDDYDDYDDVDFLL